MHAFIRLTVTAAVACLAACGGSRGLDKAITDSKTAVQGNSHSFHAPPDVTLHVVAGTLVQKGFAIEQADATMGLIKATRSLQDPNDPDTTYRLSATAYVSAAPDAQGSVVTLAASQQTVLYRKGHSWTMLPILPIIPIPTGKKYETVVTGEGSIVGATFYTDFFAAIEQGLANAFSYGAAPKLADAPAADATQH
jgi:hypothetical protein